MELNENTPGNLNIKNNFENKKNICNNTEFFLDGIIPSINSNKQKLDIKNDNKNEEINKEINEKKENNNIENKENKDKMEIAQSQQTNIITSGNDDEIILDKNKLDKIYYHNNYNNNINSTGKLNLKEEKNSIEKKSGIISDLSNNNINNEIEKPRITYEINFNNNINNMLATNYQNNKKYIPLRGNSKKKNKGLPLVGTKKNNFEKSKTEFVGDFNITNINFNNLKSTNVGVKGFKIADRIIE